MLSWTLLGGLLLGCAATQPAPETATVPATEPVVTLVDAAEPGDRRHPEAAFDPEALFELLAAELALRRGNPEQALEYYLTQARRTRDPGVVARAVRLAGLSRDSTRSLELSELWVSIAPEDPAAKQAAAVALIRENRLREALEHLAALRAQAGAANFGYLALQAAALDPAARDDLLEALERVHARFPDDPGLAIAQAVLLDQARRPAEALGRLDGIPVAELTRDAILLRVRLLEELGRRDEAIDWLGTLLDGGDDLARLRFARARLLIDAGRLPEAQNEFEKLLERVGNNAEILLSLALLSAEQQRIVDARGYLQRLLATGRRSNAAHYYLGELATAQGDVDTAIGEFIEVGPGSEFRGAQLRAGALLLEQSGAEALSDLMASQRARHPEEAVDLWLLEHRLLLESGAAEAALAPLDAALAEHPDDAELRYSRALARNQLDDIDGLEADLRHILRHEPDNSMALNALGYVLADRTDRYEEAKVLIKRALEIRPDEPAYIDSLGWVEYRLGNHERALELLAQAFDAHPDHEIAAHFGEVLWVLGEREEALEVWRQGLELNPESALLEDTMLRLIGSGTSVQVGTGEAR